MAKLQETKERKIAESAIFSKERQLEEKFLSINEFNKKYHPRIGRD